MPTRDEYENVWKPLYSHKVSVAFAKILYELDLTNFVASVELPNTAEKDYQKQRSLSFPYNALYEWIERGYIIPADFCAKLNYSSVFEGLDDASEHVFKATLGDTGHMDDNVGFGMAIPTSLGGCGAGHPEDLVGLL